MLEIEAHEELRREIYPHLVSRDPNEMWTAGQWMTERRGGSDVSGTDTVARRDGGVSSLRRKVVHVGDDLGDSTHARQDRGFVRPVSS